MVKTKDAWTFVRISFPSEDPSDSDVVSPLDDCLPFSPLLNIARSSNFSVLDSPLSPLIAVVESEHDLYYKG